MTVLAERSTVAAGDHHQATGPWARAGYRLVDILLVLLGAYLAYAVRHGLDLVHALLGLRAPVLPPGPSWAGRRMGEFDADLNLVVGQRILVALGALPPLPIDHAGGEPIDLGSLEDAPDPCLAKVNRMAAAQVHPDTGWPKVVVPPEAEDPLRNFPGGRPGVCTRAPRPVPQPFLAQLLVPAVPSVIGGVTDPVVPARLDHIAADFLDVLKPGLATLGHPLIRTLLAPPCSARRFYPMCHGCPAVPDASRLSDGESQRREA